MRKSFAVALGATVYMCLLCFGWQAHGDGCFVFKWDKKTDINEPAQKAIIVHYAGREDLLLQVKFEGRLEEFGWLIPVPSLPKVRKGSMEAFYELSQLTQQHLGDGNTESGIRLAMSMAGGPSEPVKVVEIKTVGAYEVAILSAQDAGSLARWLKLHGYSLPGGKSEVVDDYIRKGWYFVAAKIQLKKPVAVNIGSTQKRSKLSNQDRKVVRKKLNRGELHPLLISFDTPTCIFPLKISAVGGHPSEVSLYVLAAQPLMNRFVFDEACGKLEQRRVEWEKGRRQREQQRQQCLVNLQTLHLLLLAWPHGRPTDLIANTGKDRDPFIEDFNAMAMEEVIPMPDNSLEDYFYVSPEEFFQCMEVGSDQLSKTGRSLPRLKGNRWFLTKIVRTFTPAEMRDLEFAPAIPAMTKLLSRPIGPGAGKALTQLGSNAVPVLLAACNSKNSIERMSAAFGFERLQNQQTVEPLLSLLRDEAPQVRLHAIRAAAINWDSRFKEPLIECFRDASQQIRSEAVKCLSNHEDKSQSAVYLALLKDSDPNVQLSAARVMRQINPDAIPPEPFVQMLKSSNPDLQYAALQVIAQMRRDVVPRADLLPLLRSPRRNAVMLAWSLIEGTGQAQPESPKLDASAREREWEKRRLSSAEAAPLMTHQLGAARLLGLKIMERNADARAVKLTIPLLRDRHLTVQNRAFSVLKSVTGQEIPLNDPKAWEQWWITNKTTFDVKHSQQ
jgi:HEAT repeat protein